MHKFYWTKSFKIPSGGKLAAPCAQPRTFKVIAWVNILFQLLLPLSLSFTPAIAAVATSKAAAINSPTESYILGAGENINIVAKRNGMTVDELKRINIYRTFAKPFMALTAGDEIDVPRKVSPFSIDNQKNINTDISLENKLAGHAQIGAAALASGHIAKSGEQMVRSAANNEFNSQAQQWLSQFGTARVQMNLNDDFKLDGSAVDVLVPLYDNQKSMLFTQLGARNKDSRNTINIGAGVRTFHNNWMYGANTFFDNDITGKNRRVGVGAEAWTDYLKLSANSYFGITDWHQSRDFADYNERPANGYDVQAEAYLPAYPQLGAKLAYEKYRGDEVALFGKDNRQKNPHAVTAGVNYTPIPLLTVGAEHRAGKGSKNDSSINFQLNYRLGESWQSHINPSAVASTRTLAGSRYDLVERNNNIVLDYQKQEVIRLQTADLVTGYAGEQKSLDVSVNSQYGLERIDWSVSYLVAAGGKVIQKGGDWAVVLPESVNTYTISAVAIDKRGNISSPSETQVMVQVPEVNKENSTFTPANSTLPADGESTQVLTLTVKDSQGNAVNVPISGIEINSSSAKSASVSSPEKKGTGVIDITVTAGNDAETLTISLTVQGVKLPSAQVIISDMTPDAQHSAFTASPDIILADNTALSVMTLILRNADGTALSGLKERLSFVANNSNSRGGGQSAVTISDIIESEAGHYTATIKGSQTGEYSIVPQFSGNAIGNLFARVTLIAGTAAQVTSAIKTDSTTYAAGSDMEVTVTLRDVLNNPVNGQAAALTNGTVAVPNAGVKTGSSWSDNNDGSYTRLYTAQTAGSDLKAQLKLTGWVTQSESVAYRIWGVAVLKDIFVNNSTFAKDAGFPTTGFTGAKFTLNLMSDSGGTATDYSWDADAPWVSVSDGVVSFTGTGNGNKVTITGTPKSGIGATINYSYTVKGWYINSGATRTLRSEADAYCATKSDYKLPTVRQLSSDNWNGNTGSIQTGSIGGLYGEWGSLTSYSGAGFDEENSWASEWFDSDYSIAVNTTYGSVNVFSKDNVTPYPIVCRKPL